MLLTMTCRAGAIVDADPGSIGTPIDDLALEDLGIDPNLFLFSGNTMYDYQGIYQLDIVGADIDPWQTSSLDSVSTTHTLVNLEDDQSGSDVPEPVTALLMVSVSALLIFSWRATNWATDSSSARDPSSGISFRTSRE